MNSYQAIQTQFWLSTHFFKAYDLTYTGWLLTQLNSTMDESESSWTVYWIAAELYTGWLLTYVAELYTA